MSDEEKLEKLSIGIKDIRDSIERIRNMIEDMIHGRKTEVS